MKNLTFSQKGQINEGLTQLYFSIPKRNFLWFNIFKVIVILTVSLELLVNMLFLRKREHISPDYPILTLCESGTPIYFYPNICLPGPRPLSWLPIPGSMPFLASKFSFRNVFFNVSQCPQGVSFR